MAGSIPVAVFVVFFGLAFLSWRRYRRVAGNAAREAQLRNEDSCPYSLTDAFDDGFIANARHQQGVQWLTEIFSRSAKRFPDHTALQVPHTGESLTYAELDARAQRIAAALSPFLTGPDQVVAVVMAQDNCQIVASHLGILKAGGVALFLDTTVPEALLAHMLDDARPVAVLTRGQDSFRGLPTLDVLTIPQGTPRNAPPPWLDDPTQRLATLFYTSGTTGMPKGVECPHAGYVNLALSYADYFDLTPGMDATTLTSSLGYDGSISELYSAWVSGCAVVLLTKEQMRSGPDLVDVLRESEVTMLFCPPVLLTTLTVAPERDLPYPLCRYIVPAGEAFPSALVEPWTRGRRQIINTYGPTEASTDTSRQSLRPGEPVTIGSPFANVTYVILEVDGLHPLRHGEVGELCIGGVHVARGYRNLPGQTARSFITHPRFGRLYRTGDRCRIDIRTQQVHFLGRIDAQLKVRGHRVETQPVEDILQTQFAEIEAAVLHYRNEELVAFVAAPSVVDGAIRDIAPAPAAWTARITESLARQLPAPSVPSRIFLVERFVMKPVSGKIDRQRLPDLSRFLPRTAARSEDDAGGSPMGTRVDAAGQSRPSGHGSEIEAGPAQVLTLCRDVFDSDLGWDDVFVDHGGHSIVIARLAQRLHAAGWAVPVRALLTTCSSPRKVARRVRDLSQTREPPSAAARPGHDPGEGDEAKARVLSVAQFTTLQALFLCLLYAPHLLGFLGLVALAEIGEFFLTADLWEFVAVGFLMYLASLALPFASLLWTMTLKFFIGGHPCKNRLSPGVYPRWSWMHLRIWCIGRMERSVLQPLSKMFRSAPLMACMLRQLGATVGDNLQCASDVEFSGPLDLLSIGDDVAIQTGAYVHLSRWVENELHVGCVHLGSDCTIGMRAGIANNVTVGRGSWITALTPVLSDVGEGEIWEGSPARFAGRCMSLVRPMRHCPCAHPSWSLEAADILVQVCLEFVLLVAPTAAVAWLAASAMPVDDTLRGSAYFQFAPLHEVVWHLGLFAFITTWVTIVLTSVLGCVFLRFTRASPGLYPVRGLKGTLLQYRVRKLNQIQRLWTWTITGQYLRALAGVRFTHLGASECDVMLNLVPELVRADPQVFWAHGCFTNMLEHGARHLRLRPLDMSANFFASNNCVVESGQLPVNFLVGVSTPVNDLRFRRQMRLRSGESITVAGNPPVRFGSMDFEAQRAAQELPGFPHFLARVSLNDLLGIGLLPIAEVLAYTVLFTIVLRLSGDPLIGAFVALILAEFTLVALCVLIKKILVGRDWGQDDSTSFWSWKHFAYFFAQDCFFAWCRRPLGILAGTVLANPILRWMGCQVGRRTLFTAPLQASDWNAVNIGDDCIVAGFLQFHSFENMTLKVKRTEIRDRCSVNFGATVMGGAILEPGTTLLPLSMALKEMHLPAATYEGSPAEAVGDTAPRPASLPARTRSPDAPGDSPGASTTTPGEPQSPG